jgi:hypothetical protein
MKSPYQLPPILIGLSLLVACLDNSVESAGATETGNTKVIGSVRGAAGTSAARVRVELVPVDYNPMESEAPQPRSDTTAEDGEYSFIVREGTAYNVTGVHLGTGERFLVRNIRADDDSTRAPTGELAPPGAVKVVLGDLDTLAGAGLYLAGTPHFVRIDSAAIARGYLLLDSVPPGLMPGLLLYTRAGEALPVVAEDLLVVSSDRVTLANGEGVWRQSRRLYLNTSPTGADVSESVEGFPLLVRLDSSNFDFAEARDSGQDLRFANPDGSPLPHEIARWHASASRAEVWVRVDRIRGNDDSQYIEMFWGNSRAPSLSDGAAVFDTANGFVSVWHLDADQGSNPIRFDDATANRLHGTGVNMAASDGVEGMVGTARRFNGVNAHINVQNSSSSPLNLPQRTGYTVSAWVRADSLASRYQTLVGKGDNQYNLQISRENMWHFVEAQQHGVFEAVEAPAQTGAWRLLTGVREGAGISLYVDGVLVSRLQVIKAETAVRNESYDVSIGWNNQVAGQPFAGALDEVTISRRARSPEWIKLTFENQKRGQSLVRPANR